MTDFKEQWTLEAALEILRHPTVDSRTWADAVEWLLLYGPPEIQQLLQEASGHATRESFPDLRPTGFTPDGQPCYDIGDIARSLNISEEEAARMVAEKEMRHGMRQLFDRDETHKIQ